MGCTYATRSGTLQAGYTQVTYVQGLQLPADVAITYAAAVMHYRS